MSELTQALSQRVAGDIPDIQVVGESERVTLMKLPPEWIEAAEEQLASLVSDLGDERIGLPPFRSWMPVPLVCSTSC